MIVAMSSTIESCVFCNNESSLEVNFDLQHRSPIFSCAQCLPLFIRPITIKKSEQSDIHCSRCGIITGGSRSIDHRFLYLRISQGSVHDPLVISLCNLCTGMLLENLTKINTFYNLHIENRHAWMWSKLKKFSGFTGMIIPYSKQKAKLRETGGCIECDQRQPENTLVFPMETWAYHDLDPKPRTFKQLLKIVTLPSNLIPLCDVHATVGRFLP